MTYKLGQTIYVVKGNTVQPVLVVEEIVKKTLSGSDVAYLVQYKNNAPVPLTDIGTEFFDDAKSAKKTLIERATGAINAIIDDAQKNAKEWYLQAQVETPQTPPTLPRGPTNRTLGEDGCQMITLEDGTKARVRMG
jgi:hypothetical protein